MDKTYLFTGENGLRYIINNWASDARTDREFSSVCEEIGLGHATDKILAVISEVQEG